MSSRDGVLLHVLRHVDAHHRALVVEQERGERFGELGLADPGGAEEHERADRPVRVLQAGAGAPDRGRHRGDRLPLADDPPRDLLLHLEQLLALALEHLVDRHAGPARHDLGDVIGGHRLVHQRAGLALLLCFGEPLLKIRNRAVGEFTRFRVVALALRLRQRIAGGVEVFLELLGNADLVLLRLPARGQGVGLLLKVGELGLELL